VFILLPTTFIDLTGAEPPFGVPPAEASGALPLQRQDIPTCLGTKMAITPSERAKPATSSPWAVPSRPPLPLRWCLL